MSAEHVITAFEAMQGADLTPAAKLLLVTYALHLAPDGTPTKSWRKLEKICGIQRHTTVDSAKILKDLGLLDVVQKMHHPGAKNTPQGGAEIAPPRCKNCTTEDQPLARVLINNKNINNTRSNAGARACEFVTSGNTPETRHHPAPEPETVSPEAKALNAFCAAWPKRTFPSATGVRSAWQECRAEGVTADELMRCLAMDKMSNEWAEQNGRFIPKASVWLHERRFERNLARIRAEVKRRAEEKARKASEDEIKALVYSVYDEEEEEDHDDSGTF